MAAATINSIGSMGRGDHHRWFSLCIARSNDQLAFNHEPLFGSDAVVVGSTLNTSSVEEEEAGGAVVGLLE